MNQSFINQGNPLEEHFSRVNAEKKQGNQLNGILLFGLGALAGAALVYLYRNESNGIDINDYLTSEQS